MEQRNCKNCGAPLQHSYNHKCKYCGTLFDFNEPQEETVELHSYDMVNLKYRGIEEDFITHSLLMKFEGLKIEAPKIYEYNGNEHFVSKAINYINPPKSYFFIQLDIDELEKYGMEYLEHVVHCAIRPSEWENVKRQIIENGYDFYRYTKNSLLARYGDIENE